MKYDRRYIQFLDEFNRKRDYYECHELLEDLWIEEGREALWQGLLQIAVALYHFRNGNRSGAQKLFDSALIKLEPYPDVTAGIDLARLREEAAEYLERLRQDQLIPINYYDLTIQVVDPILIRLVQSSKQHASDSAEEDGLPPG